MEYCLIRYQQLVQERPELFRNKGVLEIELDMEKLAQYMSDTGHKVGVQYESDYHILVVDLVYSDGGYYCYERIVKKSTGNGSVIIPRYQGKIVLLKQFRHALREEQYALPRGFGEDGLTGEENARKELKEEIGASVTKIQFLGNIIADSGLCGEEVAVYLADLEDVNLDSREENINKVLLLEEETFVEWIGARKIGDGYTLGAYTLMISRRLYI